MKKCLVFIVFILVLSCNNENVPTSYNYESSNRSLINTSPPNTILNDEFHLISPADNHSTTNYTVTFSWQKWILPGDVEFLRYIFIDGEHGVVINDVDNTSTTVTFSDDNYYEWTVKAQYRNTITFIEYEMPYIETWTVAVGNRPVATQIFSTTYAKHPKIYWQTMPYADSYKIYKSNYPSSGNFALVGNTSDTYFIDYNETISAFGDVHDIFYMLIPYNDLGSSLSAPGPMSDIYSVKDLQRQD